MLKSIAIVTLVVRSLAGVEPAWQQGLAYTTAVRGEVSAELARAWDAPAMAGQPYLLMRPASGSSTLVRFIEAPAAAAVPAPYMTYGWNATELLVRDPDALSQTLPAAGFRITGPPANLGAGETAPRAMQVVGPGSELLYLTRILPGGSGYDLDAAQSPVDRVFIMVVGGASIDALRGFYQDVLGLPVGETMQWRISGLSRAHGLPMDTRFPLAIASLRRNYLVELDGYPDSARPRPRARGALPGGLAMVSFAGDSLGAIKARWRHRPVAVWDYPYDGRRLAVTIGPAGEWIEVIEALPTPARAAGLLPSPQQHRPDGNPP